MGVDKKTVSATIKKLLKRKWIKELEKKAVRGGVVRQFAIVNLWKINIEEYESGAEMTAIKESGRQIPTKESGSVVPESGRQIPESGRQTDTKKNYINIYKKRSPFKKNKKPFYKKMPMRFSKGQWWVLPPNNGEWLEFAGKESEIDWI